MAVVAESAAPAAAAAVIVADEKPVTAERSVEVVVSLTPTPPTADVPLDTLMNAVATATIEDIASETTSAVTPIPIKPKKVEVVRVPKKKGPMASPLARLFAEELGIDLTNLGRGSGKDGKILIDDVRDFQSRLEAAKKSMTSNMGRAYFAAAST
jgi:pyruvate/2-oxoglutarate dehydrogenase complex dihydrolipoamide acyltransferase (E2) component